MPSKDTTFHDLSFKDNKGSEVAFDKYKGHVVLVVNVASQCGFTPQYDGLEKLYQQYKDQGFVIVGFPSNQFGGQEPGSNDEIASFCKLNFGVTFPIMDKSDVNGKDANAVFQWLKAEKKGFLGMKKIKWNFEKFLIDQEGNVVNRYSSLQKPETISKDVADLIKKGGASPVANGNGNGTATAEKPAAPAAVAAPSTEAPVVTQA